MGHIVTPDLGKEILVRFSDPATGKEERTEIWEYVTVGNNQVYKTPKGNYMTHGIIGWFDVSNQVFKDD